MERILLAGATGGLGRHFLKALKRRGYWVRALVRRASHGCGEADDVVIADLSGPVPDEVCAGIDIVISSVGGPISLNPFKHRRSYGRTDVAANTHLLTAARDAGVRKFVYVSVFATPVYADEPYVRAHEQFAERLRQSGLDYLIVRPTGFFSAFDSFLAMARYGVIPVIGSGESKTNPIAEADLAEVCVDALASTDTVLDVGGPETRSRREIAAAAFAALGKKPLMPSVPVWLVKPMIPIYKLLNPRFGELMSFLTAVSHTEVVAPQMGHKCLADHFAERVQNP